MRAEPQYPRAGRARQRLDRIAQRRTGRRAPRKLGIQRVRVEGYGNGI
jgi:hypothetical protein